MTAIPPSARRALNDGALCYLAAGTSLGPHLTPVVYAFDSGAVWVTTSRSSVKARAWRRDRSAAGLVRAGDLAVSFRGSVRAFDAFDPATWAGAAAATPALVGATTRFALRNARFFAGYAVDASRVPFAWSPPGRVFVRVSLEDGAVLDLSSGSLVETWGGLARAAPTTFRAAFRPAGRARSLDLRVPAGVRRAVGAEGDGALALAGRDGIVVLPAAWRRRGSEGGYEATLPVAFAEIGGAPPRVPAALVVDRLDAWRAAAMRGMMLRGDAELFDPDRVARGVRALRERTSPGRVLARLRPTRVVWWEGWSGGSVRAGESVRPPADPRGARGAG